MFKKIYEITKFSFGSFKKKSMKNLKEFTLKRYNILY